MITPPCPARFLENNVLMGVPVPRAHLKVGHAGTVHAQACPAHFRHGQAHLACKRERGLVRRPNRTPSDKLRELRTADAIERRKLMRRYRRGPSTNTEVAA